MKREKHSKAANALPRRPLLRAVLYTPELLAIFREWFSQLDFMDKVIIKSLIAGDTYADIARRFEFSRTQMWRYVAKLKEEFRELIY